MHVWQLQEAKAKLTQLIKESNVEPQIISRHGVNQTVVMSLEKYETLIGKQENLVSFLRKSPLNGLNLVIKRDRSSSREVDL